LNKSPRFRGLPLTHVVEFLKYICEIEDGGEDVLVKLFILSLPSFVQEWIKSFCKPKGISSFIYLIGWFLEFSKPQCQPYEDVLRNLTIVLEDEGFTTEIVEGLRGVHHAQYQELCDMREEEIYEEGYQTLGGEQELSHDYTKYNEVLIKERGDEVMVSAPPFDEVIQDFIPPAQEEENVDSHFPFQIFDDALFYDLKSEEIEEPFDALNPSCYNESDDMVENIDEFINVGRHKWDVIFYDGDPIYENECHLKSLSLRQPCVTTTNLDFWQHKDDMIIDLFKPLKGDLL
jgi:hypothetical protein